MGNSDNKDFIPLLISKLEETNPHIRAMAVWALKELSSADQFAAFRKTHAQVELDDDVINEWI